MTDAPNDADEEVRRDAGAVPERGAELRVVVGVDGLEHGEELVRGPDLCLSHFL